MYFPKIHKGTELRPTVSTTDTYYKTSCSTVAPLVGKTHYIENFMDFGNKVQHLKLAPTESLALFYVTPLFTFIPTSEAVKSVRKQFQEDNALNKRTNFTPDQIFPPLISSLMTVFTDRIRVVPRDPLCPNCGQSLHEGVTEKKQKVLNSFEQSLWFRYVEEAFKNIHTVDIIKFTREDAKTQTAFFLTVCFTWKEMEV